MSSGLEIHEIVQLVRIQDGVGAAGIPLRIIASLAGHTSLSSLVPRPTRKEEGSGK